MTLLQWIDYCRGAIPALDETEFDCEHNKKCNPWICANWVDGCGLVCPERCEATGRYFAPDPAEEPSSFQEMIQKIGTPTYKQLTLF